MEVLTSFRRRLYRLRRFLVRHVHSSYDFHRHFPCPLLAFAIRGSAQRLGPITQAGLAVGNTHFAHFAADILGNLCCVCVSLLECNLPACLASAGDMPAWMDSCEEDWMERSARSSAQQRTRSAPISRVRRDAVFPRLSERSLAGTSLSLPSPSGFNLKKSFPCVLMGHSASDYSCMLSLHREPP